MKYSISLPIAWLLTAAAVTALSITANSNVAVYWGQNSAGGKSSQSRLADYCDDDSTDIILLSFLHIYYGTGGLPEVNFASACDDGTVFEGTGLLQCPTIAEDIVTCQNKGKIVLLSMGGASGTYGFSSTTEGTEFADTLWNLFLGGTSETRPFGDAVLDGFDLDTEGGSDIGYTEFVNRLREHFDADSSKSYYVSAAPQCVIPDIYLNSVITSAKIDFLFVQFYNNYCGMQAWETNNANSVFNYAAWDELVKSSPNPSAKIYLGVPASESASGTGYKPIATVLEAANYLQQTYSTTFGGIMMWDASQAWANVDSGTGLNFAQAAKAGLLGESSASSGVATYDNTEAVASTTGDNAAEYEVSSTVSSSASTSSAVILSTSSVVIWADANVQSVSSSSISSSTQGADDGLWHASSSAIIAPVVTTTVTASSIQEASSTVTSASSVINSVASSSAADDSISTSQMLSSSTEPTSTSISMAASSESQNIIGVNIVSSIETGGDLIYGYYTSAEATGTSTGLVLDSAADVVSGDNPVVKVVINESKVSTKVTFLRTTLMTVTKTAAATTVTVTGDSNDQLAVEEQPVTTSKDTDSDLGTTKTPTTNSGTIIFDASTATTQKKSATSVRFSESSILKTTSLTTTISISTYGAESSTQATSTATADSCPVEGGQCTTNGEFKCTLNGYAKCVWGSWVLSPCSSGTVCKQSGVNVYCDWVGTSKQSSSSCGGYVDDTSSDSGVISKRSTTDYKETFKSNSLTANSTLLKMSVQKLNSTNFRGLLTVSATVNEPIGSNWNISFAAPLLNITDVGRGDLTYDSNAKRYSVSAIEMEEPKYSMAILVPFWGFYNS